MIYRCAVALLLVVSASCSRPAADGTPAAAAAPQAGNTWRYADELRAAQQAVASAKGVITQGPVVWPQWQTLAEAELALAKLTGDYRAYIVAGQAIEQAFALSAASGPRQGPFALRARFNFSVHRLDAVEADLAQAERESTADTPGITGLRADLAFARGQHDQALRGFREALQQREDLTGLARLALWHARSGHASEAMALFDRAGLIYHGDSPYPRAWLALQRGLIQLDLGQWDLALAHYHDALRLLPDWWLAREHIAEIHALKREYDHAIALYTAVIADTDHPEFMDALASVLIERGERAAAQPWIAKARQRYDERLATLPEATYGHGLDHFLQHGVAAEALALARRNHALRPNPEAKIALAEALLKAQEPKPALPLLREALASGWNTAALHAMAARVFAANGLVEEAVQQKQLALKRNPRAARQYGLPE